MQQYEVNSQNVKQRVGCLEPCQDTGRSRGDQPVQDHKGDENRAERTVSQRSTHCPSDERKEKTHANTRKYCKRIMSQQCKVAVGTEFRKSTLATAVSASHGRFAKAPARPVVLVGRLWIFEWELSPQHHRCLPEACPIKRNDHSCRPSLCWPNNRPKPDNCSGDTPSNGCRQS